MTWFWWFIIFFWPQQHPSVYGRVFGTTWGWINDDRTFIFGWMTSSCVTLSPVGVVYGVWTQSPHQLHHLWPGHRKRVHVPRLQREPLRSQWRSLHEQEHRHRCQDRSVCWAATWGNATTKIKLSCSTALRKEKVLRADKLWLLMLTS